MARPSCSKLRVSFSKSDSCAASSYSSAIAVSFPGSYSACRALKGVSEASRRARAARLMCANRVSACRPKSRRTSRQILFTESHPVEICEIDGRLRSGRCCRNTWLCRSHRVLRRSRGTARLGRHGACCLSVRLELGCGCLAASKARRQWSRRRKLRLLADPGFHIWFRTSPPPAGSPSSPPGKISL
jgi:hypothetical protein